MKLFIEWRSLLCACTVFHFLKFFPRGRNLLHSYVTVPVTCRPPHTPNAMLIIPICKIKKEADLEVWEAVVEENVPAAEEELLLTDTQQAGHQRIQGLVWGEETDWTHVHHTVHTTCSKVSGYQNKSFIFIQRSESIHFCVHSLISAK